MTAVAATPTCFRSWSSLVAALDASTQPSADLATNLPASISCSWHTGELIVGATTWRGGESKRGGPCVDVQKYLSPASAPPLRIYSA